MDKNKKYALASFFYLIVLTLSFFTLLILMFSKSGEFHISVVALKIGLAQVTSQLTRFFESLKASSTAIQIDNYNLEIQ